MDDEKRIKAYYDLTTESHQKKYGVVRLATAEEVAAEMERRSCRLVEGKTVVIQEGYAPGGVLMGVYTNQPELVRGAHELELVPQIG